MLYEIFCKHPEITTDSRKIKQGSLFFALKGESFDGNKFAHAALDSGAAYAVVDDPAIMGENIIFVKDVLAALQELAHRHRKELDIPIIALTGSNGKTTTKEFIKRVLETKYKVGATVGNLNNHIGVPLTILGFDKNIEIGIVEMGANHIHEIEQLCEISQPNVGLITNVGRAHLEGFGSVEGVKQGKGELYDFLHRSGGIAIYNQKDPVLAEMITQREGLASEGYDPTAQYLQMSIYGEYNQLNAQAAYAVGMHFGVDPTAAKEAVKNYIPENNRSQVYVAKRNTLYLDAYNANPSSMRAAIDNFAKLDKPNKVVILGEMRELGEFSDEEHAMVAAQLENGHFESVYLVGRNFEKCQAGFSFFEDAVALAEFLRKINLADKHILVKGSRGVALEKVVELL